ncbi:MAG: hypothetical protein M3015_01800 [Bacteroidota bacterium]|nr:hypothetical protein [Bacteroidota bacterium]
MTSNIAAILKLIFYIGTFSHLLPLVFFLLFKRNSKEKSLRAIFYYILYCILNEFAGYYFHLIHVETPYFLYSIFTVLEFSFFCLFYYYVSSGYKIKKLIFPIWIFFIIIAIIDFFFINKMGGFDSFTSGLQSLLIIGMCIYYLFQQIKGSTNLQVYSTSNFWIIITFLIYLSGTFFLYIFTETMIHDKHFQNQYIYINSSFNIIKNILLSIAMLMKSDEVKPQQKRNYEWDAYNPLN